MNRANLVWKSYFDPNVHQILDSGLKGTASAKGISATAVQSAIRKYSAPKGGDEYNIIVPLLDDVTIDTGSEFTEASSVFPQLDFLQTTLGTLSGISGTTTKLQSMFDLQVWKKTNPFRLNLEVMLYTKTDAIMDVLVPAVGLLSLSILSARTAGGFSTPGVSLRTFGTWSSASKAPKDVAKGKATAAVKTASSPAPSGDAGVSAQSLRDEIEKTGAKILKLRIPGIITIPDGIVKTCKPLFSKELTESGAPLWCKLAMEIESIFPASDEAFLLEINQIGSTRDSLIGSLFGG